MIQVGLWLSSFASALMSFYGASRHPDHKSFANAQSLIRVVIDTASGERRYVAET